MDPRVIRQFALATRGLPQPQRAQLARNAIIRVLAGQITPPSNELIPYGGFGSPDLPPNSGNELGQAVDALSGGFAQGGPPSSAFTPGGAGPMPSLPNPVAAPGGGVSPMRTDVSLREISSPSDLIMTGEDIRRRYGRNTGSFDTQEECFADKWWHPETNTQDCKNYPTKEQREQMKYAVLTPSALRQKAHKEWERKRCADRSLTNARDFASAEAVADYLFPNKMEKWRKDFAQALDTLLRRCYSASEYAETTPKNTNQGATYGGHVYKGSGGRGWKDSEVNLRDDVEPDPRVGEYGGTPYFNGEWPWVGYKGKSGEPGATTPGNALVHVSQLPVIYGEDVFKKNFCVFQGKANNLQVPEIVGVGRSNKIWVFKPQYGPSGRYYKTEKSPQQGPGGEGGAPGPQ